MEDKNIEEKSEGEVSKDFTISLGGASKGKYINLII